MHPGNSSVALRFLGRTQRLLLPGLFAVIDRPPCSQATVCVSSWSSSLGLWDRGLRVTVQHLKAILGLLKVSA